MRIVDFGDAQQCSSHKELLATVCREYSFPGSIAVEFGVFQGRSLRNIVANFSGDVFGFDSFQGLPEDWRDDYKKGCFSLDILPEVTGARLVVGLFQDTLPDFLKKLTSPISVVHCDADLYSSTLFVLEQLVSFLHDPCVIIFDEYHNYPGSEHHEYRALKEWSSNQTHLKITPLKFVLSDSDLENSQQVAFSCVGSGLVVKNMSEDIQ